MRSSSESVGVVREGRLAVVLPERGDHLRLDSAWVLVTRKDPPGDEQILWIGDLPDQPAASVTAAPSAAEADVLVSRPLEN